MEPSNKYEEKEGQGQQEQKDPVLKDDSFFSMSNVYNFIKNNVMQTLLFLLVFFIIYLVDYITNYNMNIQGNINQSTKNKQIKKVKSKR